MTSNTGLPDVRPKEHQVQGECFVLHSSPPLPYLLTTGPHLFLPSTFSPYYPKPAIPLPWLSVDHLGDVQNFTDEGIGECSSGDYCRFVHPGPRWEKARPYTIRSGFDHIPKSYFEGGGGEGGRGRQGGGSGIGKGPIPKRCRVSRFLLRASRVPCSPLFGEGTP